MTIEELFTQRFVGMEGKIKELEGENQALKEDLKEKEGKIKALEEAVTGLQPTVGHNEQYGTTFIRLDKSFFFSGSIVYDALLPYAKMEEAKGGNYEETR